MSIDINWAALTGSDDPSTSLEASITSFIDSKFQDLPLPRFIHSVSVQSFQFGDQAPQITIKDITDPHPDFYDSDGSSSSSSPPPSPAPKPRPDDKRMAPPPPPQAQPQLRPGLPGRTSTQGLQRGVGITPLTMPAGGTSNMNYFHLPLSNLSGSSTPNPFFPSGNFPYHHHERPPSPPRDEDRPLLGSRASTHQTAHQDSTRGARESAGGVQVPDQAAAAVATAQSRDQDLQLTLHISYTGSASLTLTAQMVILDYPSPGFVNLPLRLKISGCDFDGVCLLAFLNNAKKAVDGVEGRPGEKDEDGEEGDEDGRGRINISFLSPEEGEAFLAGCADDDGDDGGAVKDQAENGDEVGEGKKQKKVRADLLEDIRVESDIGDTHTEKGGGQVLKNVGKVERFVLEQVRRIFEEEFVWPSWWCVLI